METDPEFVTAVNVDMLRELEEKLIARIEDAEENFGRHFEELEKLIEKVEGLLDEAEKRIDSLEDRDYGDYV
jgi:septation ring formation regulator EzrA